MYWLLFIVTFLVFFYFLYIRILVFLDVQKQNPKNFRFGKFENQTTTRKSTSWKYIGEITRDFIQNKVEKYPKQEIQTVKFDKSKLENNTYTWFGHSTILMKLDNKIILTDPLFFPISPLYFGFRSFKYSHDYKVEDLPEIDYVILSHDHYDHFNKRTIRKIKEKTKHFITPLGVKRLLERCGVVSEKITELKWYDSCELGGIKFSYTPTQHFSGRGIFDKNSTLWGSYVIESSEKKVFFSGDTGYFDGFKDIGEKYGPFDIAFIENGAYNKSWSDVHMFPNQSVQVALDIHTKTTVPIHWGKFSLAFHPWLEPIQLFVKHAQKKNINYVTPRVGEIFGEDYTSEDWWEQEKTTA